MRDADVVREHLNSAPLFLLQLCPDVHPNVARVDVVHAYSMYGLQVSNGMRVASRDEHQFAGLLYACVEVGVLQQWEELLLWPKGIDVVVGGGRLPIQVDQVAARIKFPLLPPTQQVQPEVGAPSVHVQRALRLLRAHEKTRPRVLVSFEGAPLEVVARKVLRHMEACVGRRAEDLGAPTRQGPIVEVPFLPRGVSGEGVDELGERQMPCVL
mmetsp:Transcript_85119/g.216804  ORF Transcript_85119/g.216804 Transcript_85119/m.216804 type:complete len:212 (-) Transcript_85119:601-1236(-)